MLPTHEAGRCRAIPAAYDKGWGALSAERSRYRRCLLWIFIFNYSTTSTWTHVNDALKYAQTPTTVPYHTTALGGERLDASVESRVGTSANKMKSVRAPKRIRTPIVAGPTEKEWGVGMETKSILYLSCALTYFFREGSPIS